MGRQRSARTDEMVDHVRSGMSVMKAAELYSVSVQAVTKACRARGVDLSDRKGTRRVMLLQPVEAEEADGRRFFIPAGAAVMVNNQHK